MPEIGELIATAFCERVARRGGNYNNTSNAGMGYLNCNNPRSNANANYGGRPRSRSKAKVWHVTSGQRHRYGRGVFPATVIRGNKKPGHGQRIRLGIAAKRPEGREAMAAGSVTHTAYAKRKRHAQHDGGGCFGKAA